MFSLTEATLVTQRFHLPRAIYTCKQLGVQAVGVIADRQAYPGTMPTGTIQFKVDGVNFGNPVPLAQLPTFTLSFGADKTVPIPSNATAATVQADLQNLSAIGAGNVKRPRRHVYRAEYKKDACRRPQARTSRNFVRIHGSQGAE